MKVQKNKEKIAVYQYVHDDGDQVWSNTTTFYRCSDNVYEKEYEAGYDGHTSASSTTLEEIKNEMNRITELAERDENRGGYHILMNLSEELRQQYRDPIAQYSKTHFDKMIGDEETEEIVTFYRTGNWTFEKETVTNENERVSESVLIQDIRDQMNSVKKSIHELAQSQSWYDQDDNSYTIRKGLSPVYDKSNTKYLCKAKSSKSKEWVIGTPSFTTKAADTVVLNSLSGETIDCDISTICAGTGIEINGTLLFENDIIEKERYMEYPDDEYQPYAVSEKYVGKLIVDEDLSALVIDTGKCNILLAEELLYTDFIHHCKVIGNAIDNPDLVESKARTQRSEEEELSNNVKDTDIGFF